MNTTEKPQAHGTRGATRGRFGARADTLDIFLLILAILVLTGAAAGIVIGFPQALEIVAAQASAATAVAAGAVAPERVEAAGEDEEEANAPFFSDDIRSEGVMYAYTAIALAVGPSAAEGSAAACG